MATNSSKLAFFIPSKDLNLATKSFAVLTPTFGIPRAYINAYSSQFLLFSTASSNF